MPRGNLRPETLQDYVRRAQPILVGVARNGELITYDNLMRRLGGPGRGYIAEVLDEVSTIEYNNQRPKLSAVVVRTDTRMVGGGFLGLPGTPSNVRRQDNWQDPRLSQAEQIYWRGELERVYRYWQEH